MTVPPYDPPPPVAMPAGWYPDPAGPTTVRYWDGSAWTEHTAPRPYAAPVAMTAGSAHQARSGVGIVEAVRLAFVRVGDYRGRSSRSEYWWFVLAALVVGITVTLLAEAAFPGTTVRGEYTSSDAASLVEALLYLGWLVVGLPLTIRRLHDTGKPWPWVLMALVPLVGGLIMLVLMVGGSDPGPNRWGPPPR